LKLAAELAREESGRTLYVLDEPTTGLHFDDVKTLLLLLHGLVERGNTVIVIEHNLQVVKTADWVIDLGPEGGEAGGHVLFEGPPEKLAEAASNVTGKYLKEAMAQPGAGDGLFSLDNQARRGPAD
jgi:excinuclease ABC subunit A